MSDYYVAVDENGQPYITHAFWNRKGQERKNHKYIAREKIGNRFRYFYTQKEWDAFKKAKSGVKEAAHTVADKAKELDDKSRGFLAGPGSGVNRYIDELRRDYERTEELAKLYPYDDARKDIRDYKKTNYESALKEYPSVSEKVKGWFDNVLSEKIDDIKTNEETMRRSVGGFIDRVKSMPISQIRSPRDIIGSAKIKRAYSKYKKAKEEYDKELQDFFEYMTTPTSDKRATEWDRRARKYGAAQRRLETAEEELNNAHKKYRK